MGQPYLARVTACKIRYKHWNWVYLYVLQKSKRKFRSQEDLFVMKLVPRGFVIFFWNVDDLLEWQGQIWTKSPKICNAQTDFIFVLTLLNQHSFLILKLGRICYGEQTSAKIYFFQECSHHLKISFPFLLKKMLIASDQQPVTHH